MPVSGAQLRVRFASIASKYTGGLARLAARIDRPSNESGGPMPTASRSVGARSIKRTGSSIVPAAMRPAAQINHGTRKVTS